MSRLFQDGGLGCIVKKIINLSPGEVSFEAEDVHGVGRWHIFDRTHNGWGLRTLKIGDHVVVEGIKVSQKRLRRYGAKFPVINAVKIIRLVSLA